MEKEISELKVNLLEVTGDTLTVRQGKAEDPREFVKKLDIVGTLDSPKRFAEKRSGTFDPLKTHVIANREKGTILLVINETDKHATTVLGKIEQTEWLKKLNINTTKQYGLKELAQLLKTYVMFFADTAQESGESICMVIVSALRNFSAKINTEIVDKTGDRGELTKLFERKMESHNIPESFYLKMPIFKGFNEVEFKVDICFQCRDAAVYAWLESNELTKLIQNLANEAIDAQISSEILNQFVVIEE